MEGVEEKNAGMREVASLAAGSPAGGSEDVGKVCAGFPAEGI